MKKGSWMLVCGSGVVALAAALPPAGAAADRAASTPEELVACYDSLAGAILATKQTEWNMVRSILSSAYRHAEPVLAKAKARIAAGEAARADLEQLADLVTHLGNEGDAAVAGIRKRLVEGGHHHNAAGEQKGIFDEGFVIVTREAKKVFLGAAGNIARMARSPDLAALEAEWRTVSRQYLELLEANDR